MNLAQKATVEKWKIELNSCFSIMTKDMDKGNVFFLMAAPNNNSTW